MTSWKVLERARQLDALKGRVADEELVSAV
jgi:hypothetical protein